ncbi:Hermansky-Pudlak syndrome 1 protein homolog isoform X2 [Maniola jurtina]|uniref:Hermansky-Pudlak syndrome 1 protein homolog isoform X2 n=1 Tax=Maniola jurtina TaxID=191418 RepID=UPI001E68B56A|nr:Hermansky-Pudlak syndrome 1 protein homolog isoform X2 [Maniola jurtina]
MKAVLIFDSVNDLLFSKWDESFLFRMKTFNGQEKDGNITDSHHISQLLSPIITSQRVMAAQFSNTYTSMQCKDNTTIVFDEWLDHVFMIISEDDVDDAHRELLDCKTLVQHICGQNINLLHSSTYQEWLSVLLESRDKGDSIPGASGVIGESGATAAALNALRTVSKEIKCSPHQHYHMLLFVGDKMLALYSSRGCEDLMPPDLILLSVQCIAAQEYWKELRNTDSTNENAHLPWLSQENSAIVHLCGGGAVSPCAPHSLHVAEIAPRIVFAVLVDMDSREVGIAVHMSSQILSNLRRLLLQRNLDVLPNTLDSLEATLRKTTEALRKNKAPSTLCARVTSRMLELRKSCTTTTPLTPETTATALHTALEAVIEYLKPDIPSLKLEHPVKELRALLSPYLEFLRVKAQRYFSLESYVEEFPGLVHFVYIDRGAARCLAPDMADCVDMLTPRTVRSTLRTAMRALREGYGAAVWRRGALHVCAVRWFERRGVPARPAAPPHPAAVRALPPPADLLGVHHRQLVELAFPGDNQGVSVKELVCIHLGLLPAATAVQQARRLAHSVLELTGENPAVAADLL